LSGFRLGDDLGALLARKARPASKVSAGAARVRQPVHGPLADHGALELGERAQHLRHQAAWRGGGVDSLGQRPETSTGRGDCLQREQ
jgi:hypothetical protein